jgi:hypothetical protein
MAKHIFFRHEELFRKASSGKIRPFLRPLALSGPKQGISSKYSQYGAKMQYHKLVLAAIDQFLDQ